MPSPTNSCTWARYIVRVLREGERERGRERERDRDRDRWRQSGGDTERGRERERRRERERDSCRKRRIERGWRRLERAVETWRGRGRTHRQVVRRMPLCTHAEQSSLCLSRSLRPLFSESKAFRGVRDPVRPCFGRP